MEPPATEIFKTQLDAALDNLLKPPDDLKRSLLCIGIFLPLFWYTENKSPSFLWDKASVLQRAHYAHILSDIPAGTDVSQESYAMPRQTLQIPC